MSTGFCNRLQSILVLPFLGMMLYGQTATEIGNALRSKDYESAVALADKALRVTPADARLLTMKGIGLSALQRDTDALAAFHRALNISPDYVPALEGAAQIEYQTGSGRAIPLLDRLVKIRPDDQTTHAMLAVLAAKGGDCERATVHFEQSRELIASQPRALLAYGACLMRLKRAQAAVPIFRQLSEMEPNDSRGVYRLAGAQISAQDYDGAVKTLASLIDVNDARALELVSTAWESLGDTPKAVAALRQAIVSDPGDSTLYVDFASLCFAHDGFQVGIDMINAGLARLPQEASLYLARGVMNVQLGNFAQADADFQSAEKLDPRQGVASTARGLAQFQQNDLDGALATVRREIKTGSQDAYSHYLLAEILTTRGARPGTAEFREALAAAKDAVRLEPGFPLARQVLSRLYLSSGQIDLAVEQCRESLKHDPSDITSQYRMIRALQKSPKSTDKSQIPALLTGLIAMRKRQQESDAEQSRYRLVVGDAPVEPLNKAIEK